MKMCWEHTAVMVRSRLLIAALSNYKIKTNEVKMMMMYLALTGISMLLI